MRRLLIGLTILTSFYAHADSVYYGSERTEKEEVLIASVQNHQDLSVKSKFKGFDNSLELYEGDKLLYVFNIPGFNSWKKSFIKLGKAEFERSFKSLSDCELGTVKIYGKLTSKANGFVLYPRTRFTRFSCESDEESQIQEKE